MGYSIAHFFLPLQPPQERSKHMSTYSATSKALIAIFIIATHQNALAQQKLPPRSEVDAVLANAARQGNTQLSNTKVDDDTTLVMMTYDKGVPLFAYHYRTMVTKRLGRKNLNSSEINAMRVFHKEKTCSSHFKGLMLAYGLEVAHVFEDGTNGKNLLTLTYKGSDCNS